MIPATAPSPRPHRAASVDLGARSGAVDVVARRVRLSSGEIVQLEGRGPLAARVDFLRAMTGWPVEIIPAPWGYLLIASQFVLRVGFRASVRMKVTDAELRAAP